MESSTTKMLEPQDIYKMSNQELDEYFEKIKKNPPEADDKNDDTLFRLQVANIGKCRRLANELEEIRAIYNKMYDITPEIFKLYKKFFEGFSEDKWVIFSGDVRNRHGYYRNICYNLSTSGINSVIYYQTDEIKKFGDLQTDRSNSIYNGEELIQVMGLLSRNHDEIIALLDRVMTDYKKNRYDKFFSVFNEVKEIYKFSDNLDGFSLIYDKDRAFHIVTNGEVIRAYYKGLDFEHGGSNTIGLILAEHDDGRVSCRSLSLLDVNEVLPIYNDIKQGLIEYRKEMEKRLSLMTRLKEKLYDNFARELVLSSFKEDNINAS